jgi:hypothetical protein
MKMVATRHCIAQANRLMLAGRVGCFGSLAAIEARAHRCAFDEGDFLEPRLQRFGPDYSFVDAIVAKGASPGTQI